MDLQLSGNRALITGVDNPAGIGAATARALAAEEVALGLTCLDAAAAASLRDELGAAGARYTLVEADLAGPAAIPSLLDRVEQALGPLDILINNAAHSSSDSFLPASVASNDWAGRSMHAVSAASHDAHFAVNSRAVALLMAEFGRRHIERGAGWGRIVNLSTGGAPGFPNEVSYGASKAALESYSRAAARELAPFGITVNVVSPGPIQTGWIAPEMEEEIAASVPLGRVGRPQDVADVIVFLVSEAARWLTGQTLHVGGGHRMI